MVDGRRNQQSSHVTDKNSDLQGNGGRARVLSDLHVQRRAPDGHQVRPPREFEFLSFFSVDFALVFANPLPLVRLVLLMMLILLSLTSSSLI